MSIKESLVNFTKKPIQVLIIFENDPSHIFTILKMYDVILRIFHVIILQSSDNKIEKKKQTIDIIIINKLNSQISNCNF